MTHDQAKRLLATYRPWTNDAESSEFVEALTLTRSDAELGRWFIEHCAAQSGIHARFVNTTVPAGLKEQIVSEHKARLNAAKWRAPRRVPVMVCALVVLIVVGFWSVRNLTGESATSFAAYRGRMVRSALRAYSMDLETNSAPAIRAYLAQHQACPDYALPKALTDVASTGCGVLSWQGHRVAMVCFHSGRPLAPGEKTDLFLFVTERTAAPDVPATETPVFAKVNNLLTASWSQDGRIYILAALGDEAFLKKFL